MYRRDWALARMGAAPNRMLFAAENRGEESGIVGPWKAVTEPEAGGWTSRKDAAGNFVLRGAVSARSSSSLSLCLSLSVSLSLFSARPSFRLSD